MVTVYARAFSQFELPYLKTEGQVNGVEGVFKGGNIISRWKIRSAKMSGSEIFAFYSLQFQYVVKISLRSFLHSAENFPSSTLRRKSVHIQKSDF